MSLLSEFLAIAEDWRDVFPQAREDAPGGRRTCVPAELPGVVLSAFEHRFDRTARTYLSFIGAPESDRLP
jgi:hypothetical protein